MWDASFLWGLFGDYFGDYSPEKTHHSRFFHKRKPLIYNGLRHYRAPKKTGLFTLRIKRSWVRIPRGAPRKKPCPIRVSRLFYLFKGIRFSGLWGLFWGLLPSILPFSWRFPARLQWHLWRVCSRPRKRAHRRSKWWRSARVPGGQLRPGRSIPARS